MQRVYVRSLVISDAFIVTELYNEFTHTALNCKQSVNIGRV